MGLMMVPLERILLSFYRIS